MNIWTIKAPWRIVEHNWEETSVYDADGDVVCSITISIEVTEETQDHYEQIAYEKARAIAALPEIAEAIEKTIADIRLFSNSFDNGSASKDFCIGVENRLRSALIKAKSEGA